MTLQEIKNLGRTIMSFLGLFAGCFERSAGRHFFSVYVKGQLSDLKRKNCEAIARIKWNEEQVRDRCLEIVARDHQHPEAIGLIDESGTTKSGKCTAGVSRQYNGNRGKVENCTVGVHLGYSTPGFRSILDSRLYLPEDWANDPQRRKKTTSLTRFNFKRNRRLRLI